MNTNALPLPAGDLPAPSNRAARGIASHGLVVGRPTDRPGDNVVEMVPAGQRLHIHVVDADSARRAAIARELYGKSIHVEIYETLDELLASAPPQGTVLVHADDLDLEERSFIETLRTRAGHLPVAFYSATPSPERIVRAMLCGAIDYLHWPTPAEGLANKVVRMARLGAERARLQARRQAARQRVDALTRRERDVLVRMTEGDSNKEIAQHLGISPRTVEIHRAGMLARLEARSTADAVRIAFDSGLLD